MDDELSNTPVMGTFSDVMSDDGDDSDEPSESVEDIEMCGLSENSLVTWTVVFLLQLQISHGISDKAVNSIFKIFKAIFKILSSTEKPISVEQFCRCFPSSFYMALKHIKFSSKTFKEYPVCPGCKSVYTMEECIETCGTIKKARKCKKKVGYTQCNSDLLVTKQTPLGGTIYTPIQTFCYASISDLLASKAVNQPLFIPDCEAWKKRSPIDVHYSDVYDGSLWSDMNSFLEKPNSLALQLNVDWFQPFDHLTYSVGAMYLTVLNLPSTERYKMKNVFLVGILPGPDEPKRDINSFLRPLVDDLLQLWEKGITVCLPDVGNINIKCALCCLACDIPAARKVAGFIGHSGRLGCSKCRKEFLSMGSIGRLNYSGFDRSNWPKRSFRQHRDHVNEILLCANKSEREKKESELGCRYSVLLDLPYFDPIRMTIIDPMHNLFLGTSKRFMSVLFDTGTISKDRLTFIQEVVKGMNVPDGVGRILWKIKSGFAGLTAEQWMNWTVIYSIVALKDLVTEETLECWRHFVLACRYILKRNLTKTDVQIADALLIQFCSKFEALFGAERVTPNMHLHGHLKECVLDFGPLRSYWLFAFERYNGILENQPTNNANIEPQLMRKFF